MLCDFCSRPDPRWEYPAGDFIAYQVCRVTGESVGNWAACEGCHRLIEAEDRDGLARRSLERLGMHDPAALQAILACLRDLHAKFFAHRLGPPRRIPG